MLPLWARMDQGEMAMKGYSTFPKPPSSVGGALQKLPLRKYNFKRKRGCPRGVMVKAMDCGIVVREFVLQSRYYVHFRANTLGKGMNPLILPAMG